ncbi:hypothetical protein COU57_01030 [Candidatus Pacearchaeota archaeon CG10_big_fil_rev_8_21_14_0_10_32_14]|nr:MAG: hypothetical protein COU57_01030 [Candidatus Pacearchaeota archaeon CG10_big_fil_rev_8_21_14_0_10_32_14]
MKKKQANLNEIKSKIQKILKKHGIVRAGIFGSYAKGENKKDSDIDILIEVEKDRKFSLLDLVGLKLELEDILKIKVDLMTYKSIHPYLKDSILKNEVEIL